MDKKQLMKETKEIMEQLEKSRRVSSNQFGIVYEFLLGKRYVHETCPVCYKNNVLLIRQKYAELLASEPCSDCDKKVEPKVEEVKVENIEEVKDHECCSDEVIFNDELIPKTKKRKKKNG